MRHFLIEPEVAGGWGPGTLADTTVHPPRISRLDHEFAGWLGDELLESFPCFIVSTALAEALERAALGGFTLADVMISRAEEATFSAGPGLPEFRWLKVDGQAGASDFGLAPDHRLVVSERALQILQSRPLAHASIEDFR